jgi:hypothetical protein
MSGWSKRVGLRRLHIDARRNSCLEAEISGNSGLGIGIGGGSWKTVDILGMA